MAQTINVFGDLDLKTIPIFHDSADILPATSILSFVTIGLHLSHSVIEAR